MHDAVVDEPHEVALVGTRADSCYAAVRATPAQRFVAWTP